MKAVLIGKTRSGPQHQSTAELTSMKLTEADFSQSDSTIETLRSMLTVAQCWGFSERFTKDMLCNADIQYKDKGENESVGITLKK